MRQDLGLRTPTRRDVLAGLAGSALALGGGARPAVADGLVGGTVFHDRRGNGRRLVGDPGVAGVLVSNGRDVIRTDADGHWRLHVREGDSVFVIKPPEWATPTKHGGRPCFSYDCGSANDGEAGAIDVRSLPSSIDFPLTRTPEDARFEALLFADTQPANEAEVGYLRDDILVSAVSQGAAFGINHGDVVFDDLSLYGSYLQAMHATGMTWHHCPGNHDMDPIGGGEGVWGTWNRTFGPRYYAFQHAGALFIVLNNVSPGSGRTYRGRIGADQLSFVRNLLEHIAPETLVVLSMHIPLVTYQDATNPPDNTADAGLLLQLLAGRPHSVSFSGHMHSTEHHYLAGPEGIAARGLHHHHVLTAASGSWWSGPKDARGMPAADSPDGNPNGFHVLSVDGNAYTTRFVAASSKPAQAMRVMIDGPSARSGASLACSDLPGCMLVANVFDGGPITRVSYEIAGTGTRHPMHHSAATDPFVAHKPWARPVPSSHVWKASLPPGLSPGTHHVIVRAANEYGREARAHMLLDVRDAYLPG